MGAGNRYGALMQQCVVCGEDKPLAAYYVRQRRCKACCTADQRAKREAIANDPAKAEAARLYRLEYKRAKRRAQGIPTLADKAEQRDKQHAFRTLCRALKTAARHKTPKETSAEQFRRRYRNDPEFRVKQIMRSLMRKTAKRYSWVAEHMGTLARSGSKRSKVWGLLDYTGEQLVAHLSKQFTKGMTIEAFNRGEIHIDHIIPKSKFNVDSIEELRACHALSNLRPMWAKDNIKKSNHVHTLL